MSEFFATIGSALFGGVVLSLTTDWFKELKARAALKGLLRLEVRHVVSALTASETSQQHLADYLREAGLPAIDGDVLQLNRAYMQIFSSCSSQLPLLGKRSSYVLSFYQALGGYFETLERVEQFRHAMITAAEEGKAAPLSAGGDRKSSAAKILNGKLHLQKELLCKWAAKAAQELEPTGLELLLGLSSKEPLAVEGAKLDYLGGAGAGKRE